MTLHLAHTPSHHICSSQSLGQDTERKAHQPISSHEPGLSQ
uniref:Uncharacterized protein n=1 Tax=Anguilla anguilla TaxID=7936 RepID=A0A0E9T331_ANGAN